MLVSGLMLIIFWMHPILSKISTTAFFFLYLITVYILFQVAVMNGSAEQQLAILQNADVHGKNK